MLGQNDLLVRDFVLIYVPDTKNAVVTLVRERLAGFKCPVRGSVTVLVVLAPFSSEPVGILADSLDYEPACTAYASVLPDRLVDALEANDISTDVYGAVDVDERGLWVFRATHSDWGVLFREGWWRDEASNDEKFDRRRGSDDLRIGFHHRMGENSNRPVAVQEKTLIFSFRNMGANPTGFKDIFADAFADARLRLASRTSSRTRSPTPGWNSSVRSRRTRSSRGTRRT